MKDVDHIQYNPDFTQDNIDKSIYFYDNSEVRNNLLLIISEMKKVIDDNIIKLGKIRLINNAVGVLLDNIGEELGIPRKGLSDDDYRTFLLISAYKTSYTATLPDLKVLVSKISGVPQDSVHVYKGYGHQVDLSIYKACLDLDKLNETILPLFPLLAKYRINRRYGSSFVFGSIEKPLYYDGAKGCCGLDYTDYNYDVLEGTILNTIDD